MIPSQNKLQSWALSDSSRGTWTWIKVFVQSNSGTQHVCRCVCFMCRSILQPQLFHHCSFNSGSIALHIRHINGSAALNGHNMWATQRINYAPYIFWTFLTVPNNESFHFWRPNKATDRMCVCACREKEAFVRACVLRQYSRKYFCVVNCVSALVSGGSSALTLSTSPSLPNPLVSPKRAQIYLTCTRLH